MLGRGTRDQEYLGSKDTNVTASLGFEARVCFAIISLPRSTTPRKKSKDSERAKGTERGDLAGQASVL